MTEKDASIKLQRKPNNIGRMQKLFVYLDNIKIGSISNGTDEIFSVKPGTHTLFVQGEKWLSESKKISLNLESGGTKTVECSVTSSSVLWLIGIIPGWIAAAILLWLCLGHPQLSKEAHIMTAVLAGGLALSAIFFTKFLKTWISKKHKDYYLQEV